MKFGLMFANTGTYVTPEGATTVATAAEAAGFESLWTVEHVVVPAGYESTYPYSRSGRMPGPEDAPIPDPLIWLSYVAAVTSRIRLATGILIVPQRNPLVTAKEVATLDVLSGGRAILGVGAGWLAEEFDALGVPFERRGRRLDEHIGAMRAAWTQEKASYSGDLVSFDDVIVRPQPVQGSVPIVVGGHSEVAARRAGRLGDGFFPGSSSDLPALLEVMRMAAADAGRDVAATEVDAGGALDLDGVRRLEDQGVDRVVVPILSYDPAELPGRLEQFAADVITRM
jgi:probable F420-dependent oxidoreductase